MVLPIKKHFSRKSLLTVSIILIQLLGGSQTVSANQSKGSEKPNILFILSDDAGYADFGFHGSKIMKTPHLDDLAEQSMMFKQAYVSAAVCGPSRAGILTGRYQQRFGFEENNVPGYMSKNGTTGDKMGLAIEEVTIADYLKELGYTTTIIGKWHQGNADEFHPLKRGFDSFYGFRGGARSYFEYDENNPLDRPENGLERDFEQFEESPVYLTDAFADEAIATIDKANHSPFFIFLSFNAVHTPMEAKPEDLALFPELTGKRKAAAALTISMDRAIGRVLKKLEESGIAENTLVVFTNDNGGPSDTNGSVNSPLSGTKANHLEGGIRVPMLIRRPGHIKSNSTYNFPVSTLDLLPTFYSAAQGNTGHLKNIDGKDLMPYLNQTSKERPHQTLYWKKENRGAIRDGDWKLLRFPDRPIELYNIEDDPSEMIDLALKYPKKVRNMYKSLFNWELTLARPKWQLLREYEGKAMKRMDTYRILNDIQIQAKSL
ncbi:sulfatase-like hydrolase/transferase [Colwellia sp. MSW7]|uniref:Sulfatase-like hydrolase/transferase n=1 Tax=Colwellia maritima TaxID=2912588 RepID=A0ABS9X396_9GAMM|nr:sulfatase-like hydrolase/transferase [Colwellia maritima]MCI2284714.1 sulfatase-like hydrolase/transferase [Colwellia maritima]